MKEKIMDKYQEIKDYLTEDEIEIIPRWKAFALHFFAGAGVGFWICYPWLWYYTKPLREKK